MTDETTFTDEDRRKLDECHAAIVQVTEMLNQVIPQLAANPMLKMLIARKVK